MKEGIHPEYFDAQVECASCSNTFTVGSTSKKLVVNVCSNCHPFYTGKQSLVDAEGRVERFKKKYAKLADSKAAATAKTAAA